MTSGTVKASPIKAFGVSKGILLCKGILVCMCLCMCLYCPVVAVNSSTIAAALIAMDTAIGVEQQNCWKQRERERVYTECIRRSQVVYKEVSGGV